MGKGKGRKEGGTEGRKKGRQEGRKKKEGRKEARRKNPFFFPITPSVFLCNKPVVLSMWLTSRV